MLRRPAISTGTGTSPLGLRTSVTRWGATISANRLSFGNGAGREVENRLCFGGGGLREWLRGIELRSRADKSVGVGIEQVAVLQQGRVFAAWRWAEKQR
jgi:hypothetical protein